MKGNPRIRVRVEIDGKPYEATRFKAVGAHCMRPGQEQGAQQCAPTNAAPACPYDDLRGLYNKICAAAGMRKCLKIDPDGKRSRATRRLWKKQPDTAWWEKYFRKAIRSDWLCGRAPGRYDGKIKKADYDFLVQLDTVTRVFEGKYEDDAGETTERPRGRVFAGYDDDGNPIFG